MAWRSFPGSVKPQIQVTSLALRFREPTRGYQGGWVAEEGGGIGWEFGTETHTLLRVRQTTSRALLDSGGNSALQSITA